MKRDFDSTDDSHLADICRADRIRRLLPMHPASEGVPLTRDHAAFMRSPPRYQRAMELSAGDWMTGIVEATLSYYRDADEEHPYEQRCRRCRLDHRQLAAGGMLPPEVSCYILEMATALDVDRLQLARVSRNFYLVFGTTCFRLFDYMRRKGLERVCKEVDLGRYTQKLYQCHGITYRSRLVPSVKLFGSVSAFACCFPTRGAWLCPACCAVLESMLTDIVERNLQAYPHVCEITTDPDNFILNFL